MEAYTYQQFQQQLKAFFTSGHFVWLITGNIGPKAAVDLADKVRGILKAEPIDVNDISEVKSVSLEATKSVLVESPLQDKSNKNSCVITYFEVGNEGTGLLKKLKTKLIMQFLYLHFFGVMDHLRKFDGTSEEEKEGYVYYSRAIEMRGVLGCQFLYQSPKRSCEYLYSSIHQFLEMMKEKVKKMTDEEFDTTKETVNHMVSKQDHTLSHEHSRLYYELGTHKYRFTRQEDEVKALEGITKV